MARRGSSPAAMSAHIHFRITKLQSELGHWLPLNFNSRVDSWCFDEALTFDISGLGLVDNSTIYCESCQDRVSDHIEEEDQWVNFTKMNLHNAYKDTCELCGQKIFFDPSWSWVSENILTGTNGSVREDATPDHVWALEHILKRVQRYEPENNAILEQVISTLETTLRIAQRTYP